MNVICFGDSNTYGYDPRGCFGGAYTNCWVNLLEEKTGWCIRNDGLNGREIPVYPVSFPDHTDLLIIMLGTNDLLQNRTPVTICSRMEQFLDSLSIFRERIILVAPPPMLPGEWTQIPGLIENTSLLAKLYSSLSERLCIRFLDPGPWNIPICFDGVHFTEEGHRRFADCLYRYLMKGET